MATTKQTSEKPQSSSSSLSSSLPQHNEQAPPEWDRLLIACQKNNAEAVRRMVALEGISANHGNHIKQTALHVAALWGHVDCVRILLEFGANVKAQNTITGATPLHCCVQSSKATQPITTASGGTTTRQLECVKLLIENGADPSMGDYYGKIPLDYYEDYMTTDQMSGPIAEEQRSLLKPSVPEIFQQLQELDGSDIETAFQSIKDMVDNPSSLSILHEQESGLTPLLRLVLDLCSDTEYDAKSSTGVNDDIKQHSKWARRMNQREQLVKIFLQSGADPFAVSTLSGDDQWLQSSDGSNKNEPKEDACFHLCQALVDSYRNIGLDDQDLAFLQLRIEVLTNALTSLLTFISGSKGDKSDESVRLSLENMLFEAARRNLVPLARFVLEDCAQSCGMLVNPNVSGRQGMTPLQFSSRSGKIDMVQYLLSRPDIDPSLQDNRGQTALDAARINQHEEVVTALESFQPSSSS